MSAETNSCRKALWTAGPLQLELPLEGEDLLGLVRSSGRLRISPDFDLLAWLTERWRRERTPDGTVAFTLHQLGGDLYGRDPGGRDCQKLGQAFGGSSPCRST